MKVGEGAREGYYVSTFCFLLYPFAYIHHGGQASAESLRCLDIARRRD
jgi:hypothetical protein